MDSFWSITSSQKETAASHPSPLASITAISDSGDRLNPISPTGTRHSDSFAEQSSSVCSLVLIDADTHRSSRTRWVSELIDRWHSRSSLPTLRSSAERLQQHVDWHSPTLRAVIQQILFATQTIPCLANQSTSSKLNPLASTSVSFAWQTTLR